MDILVFAVLAVLLLGFAATLSVMGFATVTAILKAIAPAGAPTVSGRPG